MSLYNRYWICSSRRLIAFFGTRSLNLYIPSSSLKYTGDLKELKNHRVVLKPVLHLIPKQYQGCGQGVLHLKFPNIVAEKRGNEFDVSYTVGKLDCGQEQLYLSRSPLPATDAPPTVFYPMKYTFEFHP
jgi:hypothetical protein